MSWDKVLEKLEVAEGCFIDNLEKSGDQYVYIGNSNETPQQLLEDLQEIISKFQQGVVEVDKPAIDELYNKMLHDPGIKYLCTGFYVDTHFPEFLQELKETDSSSVAVILDVTQLISVEYGKTRAYTYLQRASKLTQHFKEEFAEVLDAYFNSDSIFLPL